MTEKMKFPNFAARIKDAMSDAGVSVKELADRMGVSVQAVYKYTRGDTIPTPENLMVLANALKKPFEYFVANDGLARAPYSTQLPGKTNLVVREPRHHYGDKKPPSDSEIEDTVGEVLRAIAFNAGGPSVEIEDQARIGGALGSVRPDFLIRVDSKVIAAVEVSSFSSPVPGSQSVTLVGALATLKAMGVPVFLILVTRPKPESEAKRGEFASLIRRYANPRGRDVDQAARFASAVMDQNLAASVCCIEVESQDPSGAVEALSPLLDEIDALIRAAL